MLKIKLETLKHEKTFEIRETLDWKEAELEGEKYLYADPVVVDLKLEFSGDRAYLSGSVKTSVIHSCDRCLEPVRIRIEGDAEAIYLPENRKKDAEKNLELTELNTTLYYDPHAEFLDLEDRVEEVVVLSIPMKVLCREDCKGLCPYCGVNLNEEPDHVCDRKTNENSPFLSLLKDKKFE